MKDLHIKNGCHLPNTYLVLPQKSGREIGVEDMNSRVGGVRYCNIRFCTKWQITQPQRQTHVLTALRQPE